MYFLAHLDMTVFSSLAILAMTAIVFILLANRNSIALLGIPACVQIVCKVDIYSESDELEALSTSVCCWKHLMHLFLEGIVVVLLNSDKPYDHPHFVRQ